MTSLSHLLMNNRSWAASIQSAQPDFFENLAEQQAPPYLWIGCSDSRVPANEIVGLPPGQVFVHRNIANVVSHTDFSCLSVLQYAVEVLKVRHIIVCGHYGCGGVGAAISSEPLGLIDNWLRHIKDVYRFSRLAENTELTDKQRTNRLCELNVHAQVDNVGQTTVVQDAWRRGQVLTVHGWIYALKDGILNDLDVSISNQEHLANLPNIAERQARHSTAPK